MSIKFATLIFSALCVSCATRHPLRSEVGGDRECARPLAGSQATASLGFARVEQLGDVLMPVITIEHVAYPYTRPERTECNPMPRGVSSNRRSRLSMFYDCMSPPSGPLCRAEPDQFAIP